MNLQQQEIVRSVGKLMEAKHECNNIKAEFSYMQYDKTLLTVQRTVIDDQAAKLFDVIKEFPTVRSTIDKYTFLSNTHKQKQETTA